MRIIDAVWEKRNLGVSTQELNVERSDSLQELVSGLNELNASYQVAKVPAGMIDIMWKLEQEGFSYMESSVNVVHNLKNLELSGIFKRVNDVMEYAPMNDEEKEQLFIEIEKGLFYTDRIALDPHFSVEIANRRYIGWIKDEVARGTELFKHIYKGNTIGFFTFKETEPGVIYPFLAGIYKEYQNTPMGMVYLYKPLLEAKKRGAKCVSTYISTNNPNAFRLHAQFGFEFKEITNVYVRHKEN